MGANGFLPTTVVFLYFIGELKFSASWLISYTFVGFIITSGSSFLSSEYNLIGLLFWGRIGELKISSSFATFFGMLNFISSWILADSGTLTDSGTLSDSGL